MELWGLMQECWKKQVHKQILEWVGLSLPPFSKNNNQLLGFVDVQQQFVLCASLCKIVDFLPIRTYLPTMVSSVASQQSLSMPANAVLGI